MFETKKPDCYMVNDAFSS